VLLKLNIAFKNELNDILLFTLPFMLRLSDLMNVNLGLCDSFTLSNADCGKFGFHLVHYKLGVR
jgi:hypothetical protein